MKIIREILHFQIFHQLFLTKLIVRSCCYYNYSLLTFSFSSIRSPQSSTSPKHRTSDWYFIPLMCVDKGSIHHTHPPSFKRSLFRLFCSPCHFNLCRSLSHTHYQNVESASALISIVTSTRWAIYIRCPPRSRTSYFSSS